MKEQLEQIKAKALADLAAAADMPALDAVRVRVLGKKGELTAVLKQMGKLSAEERPVMGQMANAVRAKLEEALEKRRAALDAALAEAGGYMESSDEYANSGSRRSLSLTLRVPQENYESFLAAVAATGNVTYKSQQADDVTTQYMDVETRLANLEAQRTRLQELQAQADNLSDLLQIETSLTDVQSQIESWQSQLDWYSNQVQQCTVYVNLSEVQNYTPTDESFLGSVGAAFAQGWSNFVNGLQQLAVWLAGAWPMVLVVAAAAAGFAVWRKKRRK